MSGLLLFTMFLLHTLLILIVFLFILSVYVLLNFNLTMLSSLCSVNVVKLIFFLKSLGAVHNLVF